jgi:perosamine synthetase
LPEFLERKRSLAARYKDAFASVSEIEVIGEPPGTRSNYWLNNILVADAEQRDEVLRQTNEQGIMTRPVWTPMHRLPMYAACPRGDLATVEWLEQRLVSIPSSAFLGAARG